MGVGVTGGDPAEKIRYLPQYVPPPLLVQVRAEELACSHLS
ncbi:hypothetical protein [Methanolobus psychrotolerans]|nr:hypothetical protein [Methanolobus psychrotolerans]